MAEKEGIAVTTPRKTAKAPGWLLPIGVLVIAGLLLTFVILQIREQSLRESAEPPRSSDRLTAVPPERPELRTFERRDAEDVAAQGSVDAPLVLVVFSDYQCPFCAQWNHQTLPQLSTYIDSGQLRIEWRDVNMYGPPSERAARAAHAAGIQGKYWEYHDALYPNGTHRSAPDLSDDALRQIAAELSLDAAAFDSDMSSPDVRAQIAHTAAEARELGVTGTPSFLLDTRAIVGAQPSGVFIDLIENLLAER